MRKKKNIEVVYEYIGDKSPEAKKEAERRLVEAYNLLFTEITKKYGKQLVNAKTKTGSKKSV